MHGLQSAMLQKAEPFLLAQKKWPGFAHFWQGPDLTDLNRNLSNLDCVVDLLTAFFTAEPPSTASRDKTRSATSVVAAGTFSTAQARRRAHLR